MERGRSTITKKNMSWFFYPESLELLLIAVFLGSFFANVDHVSLNASLVYVDTTI